MDWSIGQLRAQSKIHRLAINPIIYSELSLTLSSVEALDKTIDADRVAAPGALFLAGKEARKAMSSAIFSSARTPQCQAIQCCPGMRDATPHISRT